jgi:hypothetical protein
MRTRRRLVELLSVVIVAWSGWTPAARAADAAPKAALDATSFEFGRVPRGTVVAKAFVLSNLGAAPLRIEAMQFSMPGMRARVASTIEPGASAELKIEWDTSHYTREAEGQVLLSLNDPALPRLALTLTGFVVSPVEIEPVPAFYLSQFQGEASVQTVTIRNNRDRDLRVTGTERRGEHFTLAVETLEPGRVFAVTATSSPDAAPGEYRESALVFTDDPERSKIRLDVNLLVKRAVHASVEAIDMGRVRIASVRANPSLLDLLRQTVIVESRSADMRITKVESDLPFVTLQYEPEGPAQRVRLDVGLDPNKLAAGEYASTVRVHTSVEAVPVIELPIRLTVVN